MRTASALVLALVCGMAIAAPIAGGAAGYERAAGAGQPRGALPLAPADRVNPFIGTDDMGTPSPAPRRPSASCS